MAEEELVTSAAASVTSGPAAESHKRKIEELELNNPPEPLIESEANLNTESVNNSANGDGNGAADESETKRPRLESNGDIDNKDDGPVSQNGNPEQKENEPEEEEPEEEEPEEEEPEEEEPEVEEAQQPQSADNTAMSVEGKEPVEEPSGTFTEEPVSESLEMNTEEPITKPSETVNEEPVNDPLETITEEPLSEPLETNTEKPALNENENEKPENKSAEDLVQTEGKIEETSFGLPKEGDVPVASADPQYGSDTQILSRKMEVPNDKVGVIIGKAGDTIRSLQDNSGAKIQIMRDADADPRSATRPLELVGTIENINMAEKLIKGVIAEADAGGSPSLVARGFSTVQAASGGEQVEIQVPMEKVGLIIGKGGETIRNLQTRSGARIQLLQQNLADGDQSRERIVRITGNKRQIETAREMIKDVMNQTARPSPLSGGYNQQGFRPRGPAAQQWGHRGPHHAQYSSYDYPQRGQYPSQGSQYPTPSYGNYPPQHGPRSNYGPSWEQRPPPSMRGPSSQGNYNYGQQQGPPDYGHPPAKPYGHGYNEVKYDQNYGPMGSQQTPYAQGAQNQYSKPPTYGMQPQAAPHAQPYVQPRPSQPGEVPYQGPVSSTPSYGQSVPPQQQSYPYGSSGQMQQAYPPPYGPPAAAPPASGYAQPVVGYNNQPVAPTYPQAAAGGYGSYPPPPVQPAANNAAYGYQGQADPAAYGATAQVPAGTYPAGQQTGYAQPTQTQPSYDQSAYPQYDSTGQMYAAPH
ncbi:hypothetical protein ACJIZ3_003109 [Penstemon smallii]|uniref:K Homology domain-containing protein n=1 Tax=Penstemon smallii TaxID=265156 RepID=A0ABD3U8D4_9LAMI